MTWVLVVFFFVSYVFLNLGFWEASKPDLELYFDEAPLNWRIITGPWLYYGWLYYRKHVKESEVSDSSS